MGPNGRHTGRTDVPLIEEGEAEARALAPVLAGHRFAGVLVSPLQRAQRTCALAGLAGQAQPCPDTSWRGVDLPTMPPSGLALPST